MACSSVAGGPAPRSQERWKANFDRSTIFFKGAVLEFFFFFFLRGGVRVFVIFLKGAVFCKVFVGSFAIVGFVFFAVSGRR